MKKAPAIPFLLAMAGTLLLSYVVSAQAERPLSMSDIRALLRGKVSSARIASLVETHGVEVIRTKEDIDALGNFGADDVLIAAVQWAFNKQNSAAVAPGVSSNTINDLAREGNNGLPGVDPRLNVDREEGSIYIETEPASAEIHVNGKYKALSPAEISLPPGKYTVVFIKHNYGPYPLSLTIKKGINLPVMVKLSPR